MKETKSLRISFTDEGGKPWTLTISNPQDGIVETDVKRVTDNITVSYTHLTLPTIYSV